MSDELNITPGTKEELWKFGDGSLKNIFEMDVVEVYTCIIHALKRIRHWTDQAHYYHYQLQTTHESTFDTIDKYQKVVDRLHYKKTNCNNCIYVFATKLEALHDRANELGEEPPEKFNDVKLQLSVVKKEQKEANAT